MRQPAPTRAPRPARRPTATLPTVGVTALTFHPDGDALAVGTGAGGLEVWDVADPGHPVRTRTLPGAAQPIEATAFSPDGRLLAAGGDDRTVRRGRPHRPAVGPGTERSHHPTGGLRRRDRHGDRTGRQPGRAATGRVERPAGPGRSPCSRGTGAAAATR
ncbi:WD40 repeat domain-containing protein [Kitasatospora sp. NPDC059795]|uniref:WD40 repeat domain-containing protein n=1 Tax=Kitasatospora sp. NPDC059795 TaxID=3346949 RepID=UPI00364E5BA2